MAAVEGNISTVDENTGPSSDDVLKELTGGLSNKEIDERLVISPKTVSNHVEHIYAKIEA